MTTCRPSLRRSFLLPALGLALALVLPAAAWASGGGAGTGVQPKRSTKTFDYYLSGNAADATPAAPATPMWVLMGGGTDVDSAFQAMIAKAGGSATQKVDVVILRTSGADGYNPYLMAMQGVDSVESLVIKNRAGASDPALLDIVARADVLFIAGGDQSTYVALWKGTPLDSLLSQLRTRHVPFGGTSAGLAVLGDVDYTGANGTVTSSDALANPYDRRVTLDVGFITGLQGLGGVITDAHLVTRDRMGRLVTFLARMIKDYGQPVGTARGIGVDEATALVIDGDAASVHGSSAVYFLRPSVAANLVTAKKPLQMQNVRVERLRAGEGPFSMQSWALGNLQRPSYQLGAAAGVLTSSQAGGSVY